MNIISLRPCGLMKSTYWESYKKYYLESFGKDVSFQSIYDQIYLLLKDNCLISSMCLTTNIPTIIHNDIPKKTFVYIYNVFTDIQKRNKGYASTLLKWVIADKSFNYILITDNTSLYTKNGFKKLIRLKVDPKYTVLINE